MNNKKISKQTIIGIILIAIFLPIIIFNMVIVIKGAVNPNKFPTVFGRAPLIVESDSMTIDKKANTGAFNKGDLIFIKKVDPQTLKKGDIITYYSSDGLIITHRIVEEPFYEEGKLTFNTKGDFNSPVIMSVSAEDIIGIYTGRIPKMGRVTMFLQTPGGVILLLGLPLLIIFLIDFFNKRKINQGAQAKIAELEAKLAEQNSTTDVKIDNSEENQQDE